MTTANDNDKGFALLVRSCVVASCHKRTHVTVGRKQGRKQEKDRETASKVSEMKSIDGYYLTFAIEEFNKLGL